LEPVGRLESFDEGSEVCRYFQSVQSKTASHVREILMSNKQGNSWSLKQRFTTRASTVLIAYVGVFLVMQMASGWLPDVMQGPTQWCGETLCPGAAWVWLPTAILALAFLGVSLVNRNPQAQFFLELVAAVSFAVLLHVY
jgi:hypothetical protein